METGQGDTNDKQKFDLLYGNLCEIGKTLLDSTAKVTGFLLLAAGWIATSKDMRAFLKEDEISAYLAVTALIGAFVFYAIAAMKAYLTSKHMAELLMELNYMPQEYYLPRKIDLSALLLYVIGNLILVLAARQSF